MTKLKKQNMLIAGSKALRKLHLIRMSCKDILHLRLKNKASQMTHYLSTLLPNDVFHQGVKQLGFDDFHAA